MLLVVLALHVGVLPNKTPILVSLHLPKGNPIVYTIPFKSTNLGSYLGKFRIREQLTVSLTFFEILAFLPLPVTTYENRIS